MKKKRHSVVQITAILKQAESGAGWATGAPGPPESLPGRYNRPFLATTLLKAPPAPPVGRFTHSPRPPMTTVKATVVAAFGCVLVTVSYAGAQEAGGPQGAFVSAIVIDPSRSGYRLSRDRRRRVQVDQRRRELDGGERRSGKFVDRRAGHRPARPEGPVCGFGERRVEDLERRRELDDRERGFDGDERAGPGGRSGSIPRSCTQGP